MKTEECPGCGKPIYLAVWEGAGSGKLVRLNTRPASLFTLADHKIHGQVQGYSVHRCDSNPNGYTAIED